MPIQHFPIHLLELNLATSRLFGSKIYQTEK